MVTTVVPGLFFDDVSEGQELPRLQRQIRLRDMVMYAAATWDFHRYHYDQAFAKSAGFSDVVVDGQMLGALIAKQVMDWAGPQGFLKRLSYRLRHVVLAGDTVWGRGWVVETHRESIGGIAVCEMTLCTQSNIEVIKHARATVELPSRPATDA